MIAAGFGCRSGCAREDVVASLTAALERAGRVLEDVSALYAPEFKAEEEALSVVAHQLGKPLVLLARETLAAYEADALTHSARALAHVGLASVAETAALAGACALSGRHGARLLGARSSAGGATCALATTEAA